MAYCPIDDEECREQECNMHGKCNDRLAEKPVPLKSKETYLYHYCLISSNGGETKYISGAVEMKSKILTCEEYNQFKLLLSSRLNMAEDSFVISQVGLLSG